MWGRPLGMPPNLDPDRLDASRSACAPIVTAASARIDPGTLGSQRMTATMIASVTRATSVAWGENVRACDASATIRGANSPGTSFTSRPKKSRSCVLAMRTAIPFVKPTTTGRGNEANRRPHAGEAHDDQHDAGHHGAHEQAVHAVLRDDAGDDDDECACRSGDLHARTAQRRHDEAGHDRAVDAGLRRQARGDGERHRQRQRDQAHGDAGGHVGHQRVAVVRRRHVRRRGVSGPAIRTGALYLNISILSVPPMHRQSRPGGGPEAGRSNDG